MSEGHGHGHGGHDEPHVRSGISLQRVTGPVVFLLIISLLLVFMQGAFTVISSPEYHVWPATDTLKVELPAPKL
jgi:hypothetical protein